jgi:hypothetical protein
MLEHFDLTESDLYVMCRSPVDNPMLFQIISLSLRSRPSDRAFSDREYKEPQELEHNKDENTGCHHHDPYKPTTQQSQTTEGREEHRQTIGIELLPGFSKQSCQRLRSHLLRYAACGMLQS